MKQNSLSFRFIVSTLIFITLGGMAAACGSTDDNGNSSIFTSNGSGESASSASAVSLPSTGITLLTADVWVDGNIAAGEEQWFKFTSTATAQYIHFKPGTLSSIYAQVLTGGGNAAGSTVQLYSDNLYIPQTLIIGQEYYIHVWTYSGGAGAYQITFNARAVQPGEVFPPASVTALSADVWADGNLAADGVQWFRFTATAAAQYIHFKPGTLSSIYAQVLTDGGIAAGSQASLNSSTMNASQSLTIGQEYYIRVWTYSGGAGAYQITFNARAVQPGEVFPPASVTALAGDTWTDGNLAAGGVQWFRFTATATAQYIHFKPGALNFVYIQILTGGGIAAGNQASLNSSTMNTSQSLTIGQEYYIRVWTYSGGAGTYQIAFNARAVQPGEVFPPASVTALSADIWANGNLTAGGVQWFRFTATAATQYIHFKPGTLTEVYTQVYANDGTAVGSTAQLYNSSLYTSRTLTVGQEYYIRVWPYSGSGQFQIGLNAWAAVSPGEAFPPADAMVLTANVWADGYLAAGGVQWFKFTATAATQYIHVTLLTLSSLYIQVYAGNGSMAGSQAHLSSNTLNVSRTLTIGQEYYIRVWPYSGSGQFRIGLNAWAGAIGEVFPPATFIPLSPGVWADVYLAVGGAQWFKFTATAAAQYISFKPGTLTGVNWQVYISSGNTVAESALGEYMLTHGQEYYIRVEPSGGGSGTYQIAFSDSRLLQPGEVFPPAAVSSLTANTWENGNIATGGEQWFRFTATAVTQYIHFKPGTLGGVYVQVYTSSGFSTGRQSNLYSSGARYTVETLAIGQEHYVRVWPYASNGSGAYQIGFTASVLLPDEAFPPASATVLSVGIWENGNIAAGGVQWFKFTATAATQYVHFKPGTLTAVYTQVYTSNGNDAESALGAYMVTVGQEYYIRVWWSSGSGAYQIGFTASALLPDEAFPPASATALSAGIWENGNIAAGGVQWFKFTATAATQYTHLQRGTPVRSARIHMFASDGTEARNQNDNFYSWITAHTLTVGQEYHIRVSSPNGSGAYQVAFNDRAVPPGEVFPPVNPAILSANVWEVGYLVHVWTAGISAAGGVQWFRFTATAATQYIHFKPGATLTSIYAYVLAADGTAAGSEVILWSGGLYSAQTLIIGQEYYVRVWPWTYDPSGSGYFQMAFNTSALPPP